MFNLPSYLKDLVPLYEDIADIACKRCKEMLAFVAGAYFDNTMVAPVSNSTLLCFICRNECHNLLGVLCAINTATPNAARSKFVWKTRYRVLPCTPVYLPLA